MPLATHGAPSSVSGRRRVVPILRRPAEPRPECLRRATFFDELPAADRVHRAGLDEKSVDHYLRLA